MSVIEVHPEELLDRELRGELTERERALLNAHLARCAPCRFERQLRADFELEHRSPLPASDLTDVIAGALRACDLPATTESAPSAAAGGRRHTLWRRAAMVLVACSVFGVGIGYAGAQLGLTHPGFSALLERVGVQVSARPKARPVRPQPPRPRAAKAAPAAAAPAPSQPMLAPAPPAPAQPRVEVPVKRAAHAAVKRPPRAPARPQPRMVAAVATPAIATEPERQAELTTPDTVATSAGLSTSTEADQHARTSSVTGLVAVPVETASRMFERANRARHRGARGEAVELYEELRERFPDTAEARLSLAVSARLQLDLGQPRAALASFDAYLAGPDRALHEEAMVGRIRALASLGREREATAAAQELLRAHPRSAFRADAEALIAAAERD